jgi:hypothetical protein
MTELDLLNLPIFERGLVGTPEFLYIVLISGKAV